MKRILAINPNTSAHITALLARHLSAFLPPDIKVEAATGAFGAAYISTEAAYAVAGHAALDAFEKNGTGCDAVLIACFGDPGLFALREAASVPVLGMAEAAMLEAGEARFSIVTGGRRWKPMLERLALVLRLADRLASVRPIALTGAEVAANPDAAIELLARECRAARGEDGAHTVILGGAGLAGLGPRVAAASGGAVIDNVEAAARRIAVAAKSGEFHYERSEA